MKKLITIILAITICMSSVVLLASCGEPKEPVESSTPATPDKPDTPGTPDTPENPDEPDEPAHEHTFVEGKCECGETDPDYVPPHVHSFVDGECECGEYDPDFVPAYKEGIMVYNQNFTTDETVTAESILAGFVQTGAADVAIVDGRLTYKNTDASTSLLLVNKEYMAVAAANGSYTVQFDMEKLDDKGGYTLFAPKFTDAKNSIGVAPNNKRFYMYNGNGKNDLATNVVMITTLDPSAKDGRWLGEIVTVRIIVKPQLTADSTDWGMDVYVKFADQGEEEFKLAFTLNQEKGAAFNTLEDAIAIVSTSADTNMAYDNIAIWTGSGNMPENTSTYAYEKLLEKEATPAA